MREKLGKSLSSREEKSLFRGIGWFFSTGQEKGKFKGRKVCRGQTGIARSFISGRPEGDRFGNI